MSILPFQNQPSNSSSPSSQASLPKFNHGLISSSHLQHSPPPLHHQAGQEVPAPDCSSGSSNEVNGRESQNHGKSPIHLNGGRTLQPKAGSQAGVKSSEHLRKPSENFVTPSNHQSAASTSSQGSTGHATGRKVHLVNGNYLLNFHYDPISTSRPQPRAPPRRQQKRKPYNKDLFFQANYKFVVLDSGHYAPESMDPDKILHWEDILCLKYCTPFPVQCPICLDDPLCPQITSCGHIFCFPCILQYLCMGEDDHKGEFWKRCPLCFTMINSKDLYTIRIDNVKQHQIGAEISFVLLTRQKNLFIPSFKNNESSDTDDKDILDSFSKFTLTSDVELSVREAMSDLDSWIARADSGLVDDIEKLPYVCAAMEQLEQRKKYWNEHRISNGNKAHSCLYGSPPTANAVDANYGASEFAWGTISDASDKLKKPCKKSIPGMVAKEFYLPQVEGVNESLDEHDRSSAASNNDNNYAQVHSNGFKDSKDGDSYCFYQAVDGQHLILHPFSMKCLLHHYGSYERLPNRITGKILQLETVTQSEAMRRRYRFLSHFSLTTTFQLCEIDLSERLPAESLFPFMDEIKNREKQRKRLARKELKDKIKAETAGSQFVPMPYYSYDVSPSFSMDDFEALGSPIVASSSPLTIGERHSFSSVARLGFAAAHDSPALKTEEDQPPPPPPMVLHPVTAGLRNVGASSFANVTSRAKPAKGSDVSENANEVGKKGKKPSRVLLSTAGGRRY